MKIFIAGASGAIGRHLVPQLVARGHEVVGTTRSAEKGGALRALGAEPVIVDALDPELVADVVANAGPEVVVHQLSALAGPMNMRHMKRMTAATNRLRIEGTDHLLAAAHAVGAHTFVAQSNALWMERTGGPVTDEDGRLEPKPPTDAADAVAALRHVEDTVTGITWANGIALRYGGFYGPGTGISATPDAVMAMQVRKRKVPIVGGGGGVGVVVGGGWGRYYFHSAQITVVGRKQATTISSSGKQRHLCHNFSWCRAACMVSISVVTGNRSCDLGFKFPGAWGEWCVTPVLCSAKRSGRYPLLAALAPANCFQVR
jgi:NAD(P)-dependent dehydrogenase (short-subunit alcohol dehydrogenase family)